MDITATLVILAGVEVVRADSIEVGHGAGLSAAAQLVLVRALPLAVAHRAGWTCDQRHSHDAPAQGKTHMCSYLARHMCKVAHRRYPGSMPALCVPRNEVSNEQVWMLPETVACGQVHDTGGSPS